LYLTHLSLTNYRNFARLDVDVPVGPALIVGANAQGKSSLLEAVYFLATFVSFHASRPAAHYLDTNKDPESRRIVAISSRNTHQTCPPPRNSPWKWIISEKTNHR
jgi:DNA replication and repair protein RecF